MSEANVDLTLEVVTPEQDCPGCGRKITTPVQGDWLHASRWCHRCGGSADTRGLPVRQRSAEELRRLWAS